MTSIPTRPGPLDLITDVPGLRVGQAQDAEVRTGVSVILPDRPVVMAAEVRGGAPGTRETDALDPACLVSAFHGLVLSGGSVFGLAAADEVVNWLSEKGVGLALGPRAIPVVPAAILFDLANGGNKDWGESPPYRRLAREACAAAGKTFEQGSAGAGFGATAGDAPGGIGSASAMTDDGIIVGAYVAVNAFGRVGGEREFDRLDLPKAGIIGANTTIAAVATNLALDKAGARRLATMAHDGMARAIRPLHTPFDGDAVFCLATGDVPVSADSGPMHTAIAGAMAADCLERAVYSAVSAAADCSGKA